MNDHRIQESGVAQHAGSGDEPGHDAGDRGSNMGVMAAAGLTDLIKALQDAGYRVVGPTVAGGAVVYGDLTDASALPWGWTDEQDAGVYRLRKADNGRAFGYSVGPHSWKQYLFPPERLLWRGHVDDDGRFDAHEVSDPPTRTAFVGVRGCEIAAIEIQDQVFLGGPYVDESYRQRRESILIVAVQCTTAASTCFCSSMGTGPAVERGFDVALTEIEGEEGDDFRFLVEAGSDRGAALLTHLPITVAAPLDIAAARSAVKSTAEGMVRRIDTEGIHDLLLENLDHPHWDEIAERCLACTNCTMVCPTCFCTNVEDVSDLTGREVERRQTWDSCFTGGHSYLHGGSVRASIKSRYRQWLTHKLATWIDQFGTSGCVGCGRCITWCPVGIDLTAEVATFRLETQVEGTGADGLGARPSHQTGRPLSGGVDSRTDAAEH